MELKVVNLTKYYHNRRKALDSFSFTFTEGIYGLMGPNGAGKSTLMNLLTDNLAPTKGEILLDGMNMKKLGKEYRRLLGYMPQQQGVYPGFTLEEFLYYMAALKGIQKKEAEEQIRKMISFVNLQDATKKKMGTLSGGMKQRALIAQALLGNPKIVILDEPTAGLDPMERIRIRNLISKVSFQKIVIIATHVVQDIEFIAKEIVMLKNGKLATCRTPMQMCQELQGKVFEVYCDEKDLNKIYGIYTISNLMKHGDRVCVRLISENKPQEKEVLEVQPMLEDVYLYHFDEESAYESGAFGI